MDWKPIETAPRDGTDVLVYKGIATVPILHIARWEDADSWLPDSGIEESGWWSYTENSITQTMLTDFMEPTHWQPLWGTGSILPFPED